jgi:DNA-binding MarR family transcriptional regulator
VSDSAADGPAYGADGLLYDPLVRTLLTGLPADVLPVAEAFAAIDRTARVSRRLFERWAAVHGLSETRLQALLILRQQPEGGMPLARLARALEITPPSLTGLLDSLEADGLVTRTPDPADRRSVRARLTRVGRKQVDELWPDHLEQQRGITEGITAAELVALRHLCLRLLANLRRAADEAEAARGGGDQHGR